MKRYLDFKFIVCLVLVTVILLTFLSQAGMFRWIQENFLGVYAN